MAFSSFNSINSHINYKKKNTQPLIYNAVPTNAGTGPIQFSDGQYNMENPPNATLTVASASIAPYSNAKMVGTYIAKVASVDYGYVSAPFRNNNSGWGTNYNFGAPYSGGTYQVRSTSFFTKITGVTGNYAGQWVQITLPNPFIVNYFTISPGSSDRFPSNFYLVGTSSTSITASSTGGDDSNNVTWSYLHYSSSQPAPSSLVTLTPSNTTNAAIAYTTFRLCINRITGTSANALCSINGLQLYGNYQ